MKSNEPSTQKLASQNSRQQGIYFDVLQAEKTEPLIVLIAEQKQTNKQANKQTNGVNKNEMTEVSL